MARGEGVCGIGGFDVRGGQETIDHRLHLFLAGMPRAHHAFLDMIGRVFGDFETGTRRSQQRDRARMAELQRRRWILVHESLFECDAVWRELRNDLRQCLMEGKQPRAQAGFCIADEYAVGDMGEPRAGHIDHAPTHSSQARIKPQNSDTRHARSTNRLHSVSETLRARATKIKRPQACAAWNRKARNCHIRSARRRDLPARRAA